MTDDATLSDFTETDGVDEGSADDGGDADGSDSEGAEADEAGDGTGTDVDERADAAARPNGDSGLSTYAWGEYTCRRCGTETDRVWRADGELVCSGCKSW